jgi:hypothetical protein
MSHPPHRPEAATVRVAMEPVEMAPMAAVPVVALVEAELAVALVELDRVGPEPAPAEVEEAAPAVKVEGHKHC